MYSPGKKLTTPDSFGFPYPPYDIQNNLMKLLYEVIETKKIGIFESPTGTGKSLSLICGALKWLEDHENLVDSELLTKVKELENEVKILEAESAQSKNWIEYQSIIIAKKEQLLNLKTIQKKLNEYKKRFDDKNKIKMIQELKKREHSNYIKDTSKEDIYETQEEVEDLFLLNNEEDEDKNYEDVKDSLCVKEVKIFICSRTHSQLSQMVGEIKKTIYRNIRCISLGSRQSLCINPLIKNMSTLNLMNESCLDMQKTESKKTLSDQEGNTIKKSRMKQIKHCIYKNSTNIDVLSQISLTDIHDIEDLAIAGLKFKACPYYTSKLTLKDAQVIILPYQMILHHKTRLQSGIDLKNNILIIDEAHNLLDTISAIYSSEITLDQLQKSYNQLNAYKKHYCNKINMKNILKINQLIFVTKRLKIILENGVSDSKIVDVHELMSDGQFLNINLKDILEFCERTRLAQKVHGFSKQIIRTQCEKNENRKDTATKILLKQIKDKKINKKLLKTETSQLIENNDEPIIKHESSVIRPLLSFLEILSEGITDGKVLLTYSSCTTDSKMKYILLNPGEKFNEINNDCRSIIIAGGTMQPTTNIIQQLFKSCEDRVKQHFFGHVVAKEKILAISVQKGPREKKLCFNYDNSTNCEMMIELGLILQNICRVTPEGVVCFFSSYDYLDKVYSYLNQNKYFDNIENKKFIFREPRTGSVEQLLTKYASCVKDPERNGALLFSVVGGKLSEGLNFSDHLARCIIIVGMPYPNKFNPELIAKMNYLNKSIGIRAGSDYYVNLCMNAVNQCIGRSIRHKNDYAVVLLLDERYSQERVKNKLPMWISQSLVTSEKFGLTQSLTASFFRQNRSN